MRVKIQKNWDHNVNGNDETVGHDKEIRIPEKWMIFDDDEEILNFYREYGGSKGFPVHKISRKKDDNGQARSVSFGCAKGGNHKRQSRNIVKPRGTIKTGCGAYIIAGLRQYDKKKWIISVVKLEHNHVCHPEDARFYKCFRKVSGSLKREIDIHDRAWVSIDKNFNKSMWYWMLVEYDLESNEWLNDLFEERSRWAGMSTTQRSEGINAYFDSNINARTTIKHFVEQFNFVLGKKEEKEKQAVVVHAQSVLCYNNLRKLPHKYILRWWRKDVIRARTKFNVGFSFWTNDVETKRYHDLCTKFGELADLVVGDETQYRDTDNWLDCKKKEVPLTIIKAKDSQKLKEKQVVEIENEMVYEDEDDDPTITMHDPLCKKEKKKVIHVR
ncbi:hypothetical protein MKX03_019345 [Papaver bracteatum]|nr:hypothetical protein MKX03_019345 [Papaver bracteatum]